KTADTRKMFRFKMPRLAALCGAKRDSEIFATSVTVSDKALFLAPPVGFDFETTDQQTGQNMLNIIVIPNADTPTARLNWPVLRCRDAVFSAIRRMHHKRYKWPSREAFTNIVGHTSNLTTKTC